MEHHVWCNFSRGGAAETCNQCKMLRSKFPENGKSLDKMMAEHFPEAQVIPATEREP